VFAGAAREAVFSQADNVRRINADFVPVALKAGLVYKPYFENIPPTDEEGRLYRELARSMLAPQGIGVVNSAGKVLDWVMAFDDDKSVLAFLDHARKQFARFPDARQPVSTERYARFPSQKRDDVEDSGEALRISERHPKGETCPGKPPLPLGTLDARLFGRALDKEGRPVADTVPQENYVEDRFPIDVSMQEHLTKALADAGTARFRIEDDLARLLVGHAYLGQLDLNPTQGNLSECEFWGRKAESGAKGPVRIRIEGASKASGASSPEDQRARIDGAFWQHEVRLAWEGLIEVREARVTRLLLLSSGSEKLKWHNGHLPLAGKADVTSLTAGHAIDLACGVRYGIIGAPVPAGEAAPPSAANAAAGPATPQAGAPDDAPQQLMEMLGPPFVVFRVKAQAELNLSAEQKQKVQKRLQGTLQEAMQFFQTLGGRNGEDRDKALQSYREKAQGSLRGFLDGLLNEEQLKRLRQLEMQQEGSFALVARPDVGQELKITEDQRKQLLGVIHDMEMKIAPLVKELQSGGNPQEIGPKIMKVRKDQESRLEAVLTVAQKKQWKEMLGKPLDLGKQGDSPR
jgi:hypothetical protein